MFCNTGIKPITDPGAAKLANPGVDLCIQRNTYHQERLKNCTSERQLGRQGADREGAQAEDSHRAFPKGRRVSSQYEPGA